jgi:DNA sulfur modification protein DndB
MNIYPAIKLHMGHEIEGWDYYVIKMKMKEAAKEIGFAHEMSDSKTLSDLLQRQINTARATSQMGHYLSSRDDRFYSSIIVAAQEGSPSWKPVSLDPEDNELGLFNKVAESFGLLTFDGGEKYYALDGQHRLASIKNLLDPQTEPLPPEGFENEDLSIIIMLTNDDARVAWKVKFRRLFSSLNRYAKPVDKDTTIIMEEDDLFAMITREMLEEYPLFQWDSQADENPKVKTKGNTFAEGNPEIITLQSLYKFNYDVLRISAHADDFGITPAKVKEFIQNRPSDEMFQKYYEITTNVWDALVEALPDFRKDPTLMRTARITEDSPDNENNLLFRPVVVTEVLAPACRYLLERCDDLSPKTILKEFKKLRVVPLSLVDSPWAGLLSLYDAESDKWKMVNEERKPRCLVALKIILWLVGVTEKTESEINELKIDWNGFVRTSEEEANKTFKLLKEIAISGN